MEQFSHDSTEIDDLVKLSFFTEIGTAIAAATTIEETLNAVMTHIGRVFAPEHWSLLLRDRKSGELTFELVTGSAADTLLGKTLEKGQGVAGWIAENAQPVIISDVQADPRFDGTMDRLAGFHTHSIIGVPLANKDEVFGVIELINKIDGSGFTPLELKLLTTIADFAAIAIERSYYIRVLKRIASLDPLTQVFNRRVVTRYLHREKERVKRYGTVFSVMMIDLDGFKGINDTFGHAVGDRILKDVAKLLKEIVRKVDIVSRYGGDEFLLIFPDADLPAAELVRDRIQDEVKRYNIHHDPPISLSIGLYQADQTTVDDIVERVDAEMYREKGRATETENALRDMPGHLREMLEDQDDAGSPR